MKRHCDPIEIALPDGKRAQYLAGSRPARYTVDDQPAEIDVTIPDDLQAAGWYWSGSFLYQPWPEARTEEQGRGPGVAISTALYGPPGYPSDRQTCFEVAQGMEARRGILDAQRALKPSKRTKAKVQEPKAEQPKERQTEQLELAF